MSPNEMRTNLKAQKQLRDKLAGINGVRLTQWRLKFKPGDHVRIQIKRDGYQKASATYSAAVFRIVHPQGLSFVIADKDGNELADTYRGTELLKVSSAAVEPKRDVFAEIAAEGKAANALTKEALDKVATMPKTRRSRLVRAAKAAGEISRKNKS